MDWIVYGSFNEYFNVICMNFDNHSFDALNITCKSMLIPDYHKISPSSVLLLLKFLISSQFSRVRMFIDLILEIFPLDPFYKFCSYRRMQLKMP